MNLNRGNLLIKITALYWCEFKLCKVIPSLLEVVKPIDVITNFNLNQKLACSGTVNCSVINHCIGGDHLEIRIFHFKRMEHLVSALNLGQVMSELVAVRTQTVTQQTSFALASYCNCEVL